MRKVFCLLLVLAVCFCLCACGSNESETNTGSTTNELTKEKAESLATQALYHGLVIHYSGNYLVNVENTTYKVASITGSSTEGYTVYGKYTLYDNYGNLDEIQEFKIHVDSDFTTKIEKPKSIAY